MAIVAKNVDMVRELLRVGGEKGCVEEMLKARACGEFFQRGGGVDSFYCGEFPLSFAVSVNDREVSLILRARARRTTVLRKQAVVVTIPAKYGVPRP